MRVGLDQTRDVAQILDDRHAHHVVRPARRLPVVELASGYAGILPARSPEASPIRERPTVDQFGPL